MESCYRDHAWKSHSEKTPKRKEKKKRGSLSGRNLLNSRGRGLMGGRGGDFELYEH